MLAEPDGRTVLQKSGFSADFAESRIWVLHETGTAAEKLASAEVGREFCMQNQKSPLQNCRSCRTGECRTQHRQNGQAEQAEVVVASGVPCGVLSSLGTAAIRHCVATESGGRIVRLARV